MLFSNKCALNYSQRLRRLRYLAIGFLLFLLIPLGTILYLGFQQIENNLLSEYQDEANNLVQNINLKLTKRRLLTNAIPVDAFDYYQQIYNPITKKPQQVLSPLSQLNFALPKISQQVKGLVGFFQFNQQGHFNSPVWPYSLNANNLSGNDLNKVDNKHLNSEFIERKKIAYKIHQLLTQSESLQKLLKSGLVKEKQLFGTVFDIPDYLIFYRIRTVANQLRLQGYVVERNAYLSHTLNYLLSQSRFDNSVLIELKDIKYANPTEYFFYERLPDGLKNVHQLSQPDKRFQQKAIYQNKLQWPFDGYVISLSSGALPMTPAMMYSGIFIVVLITVILFSCYGFYNLGVKQLALGEQRLNFVSSVSHELKTPLTSIRMYSQMLKEGTVLSETYQKEYYEFIYGESERLTRLINNILQLSKLSNQQQTVKPEYTRLTILQDIIRSKTSSIIDKNNFKQNIITEVDDAQNMLVLVEQDAFSQVIINITDNAIKFFDPQRIQDPARQQVDFIFRQHPKDKQFMQLEIRDYGEGITQAQESKIFELFYRGGNELTRSTQGTGIGLALVNELVLAQQGLIKVERRAPGLAILLSFHAKY